MSLRWALVGAVTIFGSAGALAQAKSDEPPAEAKALIESCAAHKFETIVDDVTADGQPKKSRVKLCGKEGQSNADWVVTLKDAVEKIAGNPSMSSTVKAQIITALNAEIRRLDQPLPQSAVSGFQLGKAAPPPRPATPAPEYTALPPMPPPKPAVVAATGAAAALPLLSKPRFSIQCLNPGDLAGEGPCTAFERETMVTVRAGEDMPPGTSLRFIRGDASADIALAGLRRGKSIRVALPRAVCQGVGGGSLEVQTVRSAPSSRAVEQVVDSDGPFNLRC